MAVNVEGSRAVAQVNEFIGNKINSSISYGTNLKPSVNTPDAWFGGTAAGNNPLTLNANVQGETQAAKLNTMINDYTRLFSKICRKRMVIYYNNNGSLQVTSDVTGIGNFATGVDPATIASPTTEAVKGDDLSEAKLQTHLNSMYNSWWSQAGGRTVEILTHTTCHTQCFSACDCNRGRR